MHDFMRILNELEGEIKDSKRSMLGGNRYIDEGKCMDYILTLKSLLPQDIKEAQIILAEKENILSEAEDYASHLVSDAKAKANKILDESELIAQSEYEADQILKNAKEEADRIKYETMNSVMDLLKESENKMIDIINCVRDSKNVIIDEFQSINNKGNNR